MDREDRATATIAIERGGLPTEQQQAEGYDALMRARRLERITWDVEEISEAASRDELPRPVTLADIGVVAVIADDAASIADDLSGFAARLRDSIGWLDALREHARGT